MDNAHGGDLAPAEQSRELSHYGSEIMARVEGGRLIFEPGWRWSMHAPPVPKAISGEEPQLQYHLSGRMAIRMDDGTEFVARPGDITSLRGGHDAWVIGDEQVVTVKWFGATKYVTRP